MSHLTLKEALEETGSIRAAVQYGFVSRKELDAFDVIVTAACRFLRATEGVQPICEPRSVEENQ